jgi:hypothetical protein
MSSKKPQIVNVSEMDENQRNKMDIEIGMKAHEIGLSRFLGDVASIICAVKLTSGKWLDKKTVAAVVKAAQQLQSLVE